MNVPERERQAQNPPQDRQGPSITVRLDPNGPTIRAAFDIPESYLQALRVLRLKTQRTQSDIVTEALRVLLEKETENQELIN